MIHTLNTIPHNRVKERERTTLTGIQAHTRRLKRNRIALMNRNQHTPHLREHMALLRARAIAGHTDAAQSVLDRVRQQVLDRAQSKLLFRPAG